MNRKINFQVADACDCCRTKIVNDDSTACRDFYGHTHGEPVVTPGRTAIFPADGARVNLGPCDLCGYDPGAGGYWEGWECEIIG